MSDLINGIVLVKLPTEKTLFDILVQRLGQVYGEDSIYAFERPNGVGVVLYEGYYEITSKDMRNFINKYSNFIDTSIEVHSIIQINRDTHKISELDYENHRVHNRKSICNSGNFEIFLNNIVKNGALPLRIPNEIGYDLVLALKMNSLDVVDFSKILIQMMI